MALRAAEERAAAADSLALDAKQHAEVGGWVGGWPVIAFEELPACVLFRHSAPLSCPLISLFARPPHYALGTTQACQRMMEKLVGENDALTDHLNRQALELSGLRAAMTAAAQFAQAADADAHHAEAAAQAAVGYLPPSSPMRQLSGGLGSLQRVVSDTSPAVAAAAGLTSPARPSSVASAYPPSPRPAAAASPAAGGDGAAGGAAWELPGGVMLSEQQLQLLQQAPPQAMARVSSGGAGTAPTANGRGLPTAAAPLGKPPAKAKKGRVSFWQWVAGVDRLDAEL